MYSDFTWNPYLMGQGSLMLQRSIARWPLSYIKSTSRVVLQLSMDVFDSFYRDLEAKAIGASSEKILQDV